MVKLGTQQACWVLGTNPAVDAYLASINRTHARTHTHTHNVLYGRARQICYISQETLKSDMNLISISHVVANHPSCRLHHVYRNYESWENLHDTPKVWNTLSLFWVLSGNTSREQSQMESLQIKKKKRSSAQKQRKDGVGQETEQAVTCHSLSRTGSNWAGSARNNKFALYFVGSSKISRHTSPRA